jgi:hypothetical protein
MYIDSYTSFTEIKSNQKAITDRRNPPEAIVTINLKKIKHFTGRMIQPVIGPLWKELFPLFT